MMLITHRAIKNARDGYGWIPMIWIDGRQQGSTWRAAGIDKDEATVQSRMLAEDEAARYVGDWDIVIADAP